MYLSVKSRSVFVLILIFSLSIAVTGFPQKKRQQTPPSSVNKIPFAQAQKLLEGENEGNLNKRAAGNALTYSLTRLRNGQLLELYYPVKPNMPVGKGAAKNTIVPGYGVLYESETDYVEATRTRHALEDLIPDGRVFVSDIPQLVARLEKRLRLGAGKLDYSRASLKRLDTYIAGYQSAHTTAETNPQLFQELTAYYGETLRRALNGEWQLSQERVSKTHVQIEPNIRFASASSARTKLIKPWSSVHSALHDEDKRGQGLTKALDADLAAAR
jgi:hypothetical protein